MDDILNRTTLNNFIGLIETEHYSHSKTIAHFAICLDIFTVVLNLIPICIIASNEKLYKQTAYLQVINTCISNILNGIFVIPLSIYSELEVWNLSQFVCHAWIMMDVYLPFVNILIFVFITVERIVLMSAVSRYSKRTRIFTVIELLASWIIGILIIFPIWIEGAIATPDDLGVCLVHLNQDAALLSPILTYFIPAWICVVLTIVVVITIVRSDRPHINNNLPATDSRNHTNSSQRTHENKDTLSLASLLFANYFYLTLWLPHQFITILLVFCFSCNPPYQVLIGITWLGAMSAMLCPLAWFTDKNIRTTTIQLFISCKCRRTHSAISNLDSNEIELLDCYERSTSVEI